MYVDKNINVPNTRMQQMQHNKMHITRGLHSAYISANGLKLLLVYPNLVEFWCFDVLFLGEDIGGAAVKKRKREREEEGREREKKKKMGGE